MIAVTDDFHHRVVLIDRASKRIVWQYGHDGIPGSASGYLNNPDGLRLDQRPHRRALPARRVEGPPDSGVAEAVTGASARGLLDP